MKLKKITFFQQLFFGLAIALILYFVGRHFGMPYLGNIGWTILSALFLVNPLTPPGEKWKGDQGKLKIRLLFVIVILAAWLLPDNIGM